MVNNSHQYQQSEQSSLNRFKVIVHFVDICGIVDHHCLEMIVRFVNISGIVDHQCLEGIVRFVDIGVNC
jgi:hypothetical protein